ncbi:pectinesterase-like [Senna tora]|uniref:Pectinesterase n=1 Tax=Senna tora TaxID=362788 RepID=A0A834SIT9_9FABA|nr:pectinesterase-like [Senna tora]
MNGKVLVSAVSIILVVGVAIGAVVVVRNKSNESGISAHQNTVMTMCQNTQDQKLCHETLSSVKVNDTSDPKAFLAAVVEDTTKSVIKALNMSDRLLVEHGSSNNEGLKMSLNDCKQLLESAMDSLELSTHLLGNGSIEDVNERTPDFRNWLAAVISYQQACMEGFDENNEGEKQVRTQLQQEGVNEMVKFTGVALDIMSDLAQILESFGLKLDVKPASRRLMEVDSEGYPTWFSASDRKLLGKLKKKIKKAKSQPTVVVAKDGSGQFRTITDAINAYPKNGLAPGARYVILVKAGVYAEYVTVPKTAVNVLMYGEGAGRTIITGRKNFAEGVKTMNTATFANLGTGFIAKGITFENTAGAAGHQAVAFRNQGDMSAFFDCAFVGYQDTLYVQTNRQFYRNCDISGTIDFIFGVSTTLIQNSRIILRRPMDNQFNTVTADGTAEDRMPTGIVIQNCDILPEPALFPARFQLKSYLGRPWKQFSKTVVMESRIGDVIHPDGWFPWQGNMYLDTLFYAEHNNVGPGANVDRRVRWRGYRGLLNKQQAAAFTAAEFLKGGVGSRAEDWLRATQIPFDLGFTKP